jgi:hypothetical protein
LPWNSIASIASHALLLGEFDCAAPAKDPFAPVNSSNEVERVTAYHRE